MRGVYQVAVRQVVVRELPTPEPVGDEVRIKTVLSGLCGTNLHAYRGHPFRVDPDVVQGHEAVGVVDAVGECVKSVRVGDRVMAYQAFGCGRCEECVKGNDHRCLVSTANCLGQRRHGTQADHVIVTERMALPLPEGLSFDDGIVLSCAGGTAYSALRKVYVGYDDTVVVFGLGPVGLMAVMFGKAMGARVIGVEVVRQRLELGRALGADAVVDASREEPIGRMGEITRGRLATVGVEASGNSTVRIKTIYEATADRRGTRIVYLAIGDPEDRMPLIFGQRTITRNHIFSIPEYHEMCRLIADKGLKPGRIITHRFPLSEAVEAYGALETQALGKAVLTVD